MNRTIRHRVTLLVVAVSFLAAGIAHRLVQVQVVRAEECRKWAGIQHHKLQKMEARRGAILDRRGRELAVSLGTHSLYVYPSRVAEPRSAAGTLSRVLGIRESSLHRGITSDHSRYRLARGLDPETVLVLRKLDLLLGDPPAFDLEPESTRSYPYDELAAHVVGYAGTDQVGLSGIERTRHHQLQGDPAFRQTVNDGLGRAFVEEVVPPSRRHHDVVLTIDLTLQHVIERELEEAIRNTGADSAFAILLDPATGEILALANRPTARLSRFGRSSDSSKRNRAALDEYEPGSTFKVITAAAALDLGTVRPTSRYDCESGSMMISGRTYHDHEKFGVLSFREIVEHSSNIGMIKVGRTVRGDELADYLRRFGFGNSTGLGLPEQDGNVPDLAGRSAVTHASASIGYGVSVTGMQLVSAVGAVANGGVLVPARIVLGTRDAEGRWIPEPVVRPRRVVRRRVAETLTSILEGVVERGTGTRARLDGYRVAGKTGTARKHIPGKGYSATDYRASFVGYAPSRQPRLVCLVVIDSPRGKSYYGGQTAAPVFRRIMEDALAYLRVPAEGTRTVVYPGPPENHHGSRESVPAGIRR